MPDFTSETWEEYEKRSIETKAQHEKLIAIYKEDLIQKNLSPRTIKRHLSNIDSFLNWFLIDYKDSDALDEFIPSFVGDFLGSFIPDKYIGNTKNLIKENAATLRGFYQSMRDCGYISQSMFTRISENISEEVADGGQNYAAFVKEYFAGNY